MCKATLLTYQEDHVCDDVGEVGLANPTCLSLSGIGLLPRRQIAELTRFWSVVDAPYLSKAIAIAQHIRSMQRAHTVGRLRSSPKPCSKMTTEMKCLNLSEYRIVCALTCCHHAPPQCRKFRGMRIVLKLEYLDQGLGVDFVRGVQVHLGHVRLVALQIVRRCSWHEVLLITNTLYISGHVIPNQVTLICVHSGGGPSPRANIETTTNNKSWKQTRRNMKGNWSSHVVHASCPLLTLLV